MARRWRWRRLFVTRFFLRHGRSLWGLLRLSEGRDWGRRFFWVLTSSCRPHIQMLENFPILSTVYDIILGTSMLESFLDSSTSLFCVGVGTSPCEPTRKPHHAPSEKSYGPTSTLVYWRILDLQLRKSHDLALERWMGGPKYADDNHNTLQPLSFGPRVCLWRKGVC